MDNNIDVILFVTIIFSRWTINLALTTANQMFKSSNPFDSQDLVEVTSFILCIVKLKRRATAFHRQAKHFELK